MKKHKSTKPKESLNKTQTQIIQSKPGLLKCLIQGTHAPEVIVKSRKKIQFLFSQRGAQTRSSGNISLWKRTVPIFWAFDCPQDLPQAFRLFILWLSTLVSANSQNCALKILIQDTKRGNKHHSRVVYIFHSFKNKSIEVAMITEHITIALNTAKTEFIQTLSL